MIGNSCIIYDNKICDECGDCNFCDINPDKICDDCGKCLEEGYDYTGIQIDELITDSSNSNMEIDSDNANWRFPELDDSDNDNNVIFIDDIPGLSQSHDESGHHHHHDIHNNCCGDEHRHEH